MIHKCDYDKLEKIGKPAVKPLINSLKSSDDKIQRNSARVLGNIGDPSAVEPLINALINDGKSYYLGQAASEALGKIGDIRAVEPLINALTDKSYYVRENAAKALGEIGNPRAVIPLIKLLGDLDPSVLSAAALALGEIGDSRAVQPLLNELDSCYNFAPDGLILFIVGGIHEKSKLAILANKEIINEKKHTDKECFGSHNDKYNGNFKL